MKKSKVAVQDNNPWGFPCDVNNLICHELDGRDLSRLASTCRFFHAIIYATSELVERIYFRIIDCETDAQLVYEFQKPYRDVWKDSGRRDEKIVLETASDEVIRRKMLKFHHGGHLNDGCLFGSGVRFKGDGEAAYKIKSSPGFYMICDAYKLESDAYHVARLCEKIAPLLFKTFILVGRRDYTHRHDMQSVCLNCNPAHTCNTNYVCDVHRKTIVVLFCAELGYMFKHPISTLLRYEHSKDPTAVHPTSRLAKWIANRKIRI